MTMYFAGTYDPLTEKTLQSILQRCRAARQEGALVLLGGTVLAREDRMELLMKAVDAYPELRLDSRMAPPKEAFLMLDQEEEEARAGKFFLAAAPIRSELVQRGFYIEEIVDAQCKPRRAAHSRSVAGVCRGLAEAHHLDAARAWRAGMLHDVTKRQPDEWGRKILEEHDPDKLSLSPKVWHSFTAPIWLRENMGLEDEEILHAIYHHTLGDGEGDLDRILFIADKCEPTRNYDSTWELELARRDLKAAAELVLQEQRDYLLEKEDIHV